MYSCILKLDVMNVTLFACVVGMVFMEACVCMFVHVCLVCYSGGYNGYTHTVHTVSTGAFCSEWEKKIK